MRKRSSLFFFNLLFISTIHVTAHRHFILNGSTSALDATRFIGVLVASHALLYNVLKKNVNNRNINNKAGSKRSNYPFVGACVL